MNILRTKWPNELKFMSYLNLSEHISPTNGKKEMVFWRGLGLCVRKISLTKYVRDQSGPEGKWNFNVFCLLTQKFMLVKHIISSVWFCKSFVCFLPFVCVGYKTGGVLSNMTGRVTHFASTFHGQACAFQQRAVETGRDLGLTVYTFCA